MLWYMLTYDEISEGYFIAAKTGKTENVPSDLTGFGNEELAFLF